MKKGCTKAVVDFLISDLLNKKKRTETNVNPEEDPGIDDHDESF